MPSAADESYEEEDMDGEPLANQRSDPQSTSRVAPEDQIEESEADDMYSSFPVKLDITITKDGKPGALCVECIAQDGELMIDNFSYFKDSTLPQPANFDAQKKRDIAYGGPAFGNLDEELQTLFDQYLVDRGVDTALAQFVTEYIDSKEQKEYVSWLERK